MKKFEGLLKSEIRKAVKEANEYSGFNDCTITGYSWKEERPFSFDPEAVFVTVECEICRDYTERCDFDIVLNIMMSDRRRTTATVKTW